MHTDLSNLNEAFSNQPYVGGFKSIPSENKSTSGDSSIPPQQKNPVLVEFVYYSLGVLSGYIFPPPRLAHLSTSAPASLSKIHNTFGTWQPRMIQRIVTSSRRHIGLKMGQQQMRYILFPTIVLVPSHRPPASLLDPMNRRPTRQTLQLHLHLLCIRFLINLWLTPAIPVRPYVSTPQLNRVDLPESVPNYGNNYVHQSYMPGLPPTSALPAFAPNSITAPQSVTGNYSNSVVDPSQTSDHDNSSNTNLSQNMNQTSLTGYCYPVYTVDASQTSSTESHYQTVHPGNPPTPATEYQYPRYTENPMPSTAHQYPTYTESNPILPTEQQYPIYTENRTTLEWMEENRQPPEATRYETPHDQMVSGSDAYPQGEAVLAQPSSTVDYLGYCYPQAYQY